MTFTSESIVAKMKYWYDHVLDLWCLERLDQEGNLVGRPYWGTKDSVLLTAAKYNSEFDSPVPVNKE